LGIISENTRIRSVKMAEIIPKYTSPKSLVAWAPAPAAPTVWAMVLRDSMAARGLSISSLKLRHRDANLGRLSSRLARYVGVRDNRVASSSEQRNETPSARLI
jgi:hypothetical protein